MFCGKCGHHVPDTNNFCARCGAPISKNISIVEDDEVAIIEWKTESIDYTNHSELTATFSRALKKRIIIDLSHVQFIDSTGIGTLVTLYYKTSRTKQEIKIVGIIDNVMKAVKSLSVDNVLDLFATREDAYASWGIPYN